MSNILFVLGSPREGNSSFILGRILNELNGEVLRLKEMQIEHCRGCLKCMKTGKCMLSDDMMEATDKIISADIIVLLFPAYFGNYPGILKDFIDRTNPLYYDKKLKGKKLVSIIVGGQSNEISRNVLDRCTPGFTDPHGIEHVSSFVFQGDSHDDLKNNTECLEKIDEIITFVKVL